VQVPRPKSMYALFGVTHPKKVQEIISGYMREYVEAPYLKRMEEKMGESLEKR